MKKPLEGIKILDLTRVLAGPFCTMIFQDLGAEIIKVENPNGGDDSRGFGPFQNNQSAYFLSVNRGKKSISLNLKNAQAKKMLLELVKKCDVIVENYSPGTMEKLGLGYEEIKAVNPKIIYGALSGFGHSGPDSSKPAYDVLVQARGGIMSITGWPDCPPTRVGMSVGDVVAGLYGTIGILTALLNRAACDGSQKVDVAMLDCQIAILENALARYQIDGVAPEPLGNRHPAITPFQGFEAQDGFFVIAVGNENLWEKLCTALNAKELGECATFASNKGRTENVKELEQALAAIFKQKTVKEWLSILHNAKIPCAPVNTIANVFNDEQLKHRNMFVEVKDPAFPGMKIAGNPIKMECLPEEKFREKAPAIGEHNSEIFSSLLGLSETEIARLKAEGAI